MQVVNKLVNYIEINAICLDLKHPSRIDSVLPISACALAAAVQEAGAAGLPCGPPQPRCRGDGRVCLFQALPAWEGAQLQACSRNFSL